MVDVPAVSIPSKSQDGVVTSNQSEKKNNPIGVTIDDEYMYGPLDASREAEAASFLATLFVSSPGMEHAVGITDPSVMLPFLNCVIRFDYFFSLTYHPHLFDSTCAYRHSQRHHWTIVAYHKSTKEMASILVAEDFSDPIPGLPAAY
jgi:hypothetical protein